MHCVKWTILQLICGTRKRLKGKRVRVIYMTNTPELVWYRLYQNLARVLENWRWFLERVWCKTASTFTGTRFCMGGMRLYYFDVCRGWRMCDAKLYTHAWFPAEHAVTESRRLQTVQLWLRRPNSQWVGLNGGCAENVLWTQCRRKLPSSWRGLFSRCVILTHISS